MRLLDGLSRTVTFSKNAFCMHSQVLSAACREGHFITTPAALLTKVLKRVCLFIAEPSVPVRILYVFDGAGWYMVVKIGIVVYSTLCVAFHDNLLIIAKGFLLFSHYLYKA